MISLNEAQQFVLRALTALTPVALPLQDALGCVAAEEVNARERVPGFSNAAMDGYALRAADTLNESVRLSVTGSVMAGDVPAKPLGAGEAMRIMTGAPLPSGADCVCMIEEVTIDPDGRAVLIDRVVRSGENVRHPGEDIDVGQVLITPGTELGPTQLGVLASQGFTSLLAHPRPRVGVLSTGNELTSSPEALPAGKVRDVNRPLLLALLRQSGFIPVDLGTVEDDAGAIAEELRRGVLACDAVVSTGGVSVGDVDFVKTVIGELCGERARSMQVAIRPGKPFAFGVTGSPGTPIFGLPGNPVSLLVGFELFVRPALRLLARHRVLERPTLNMVLDCALPRRRDGKLHLVHVVAKFHEDGRLHAERVVRGGSHLLSAIADANVIAIVPDGDGLDIGHIVPAMILDEDRLIPTPVRSTL